ncbi:MAG: Fic family protein [Candidatus Micrarchaeota archaeon]
MAFIRRKRKGNSHYYELVENTRVKGKVSQKALKYFPTKREAEDYAKAEGLAIPKEGGWIESSLARILEEKLKKLNSLRPLPPSAVEKLKQKFEVDMTYHSNAIEGNRLSLRETWLVLRRGLTIRGKSLKEHLEATNHKDALQLLEKIAAKNAQITEMDVLSLHAAILDKIDPLNAGFYRHEQVYIEGSKITLPNWRKVPELMQPVYGELNDKSTGIKALESAVKIHYQTVKVHPFVDGNGRLARLLMNLRLMKGSFPPTILRKEERRAYYSALDKADSGDFWPFAMLIASDVEQSLDLWLSAFE